MEQQDNVTMPLDAKACYAALRTHDARFDGRFFVGVSSTGIYCRPVCRVKLPKEENCTFFVSAAAAEAAGYRPCLKCRPELAPGLAPAEAPARLARKAALLMEEDCLAESNLADLAERLGVTDRHLRRVFLAEYGVSPGQYLQTRRLLLAKNLLTDTNLSVTETALTAGFGSVRRFNTVFKENYRLTPTKLRQAGNNGPENGGGITLSIGYRPPYAWDKLISFLAGRTIPGVESVEEEVYRRTVNLPKGDGICRGWISVANKPKKNALAVTAAPSLLPVLPRVLARVRHLFDADCQPEEIYEKLLIMDEIAPGMCVPGLRLPGCFDPFEMTVRAILGQQVTVKAARTLAQRFAAAFGTAIDTPFADLNVTFPTPEMICRLEGPVENHLGPLGITGARARAIYALAGAMTSGAVSFAPGADPEREMEKLLQLPGFGPWTVHYVGMRAFGWPDAFPHTDYGVKKALTGKTPREILEMAQAWRPWRSYATINLWNSLAQK
ncbi:MAG: AlkA N-terminal domain-containing protein [bacterium]|jgi:AraC family transcriptional regulator of adaptative response / DNA-3-methyladenine glycosylase II